MRGASFLLGGLKHRVQEYNRVSARVQAGLLFLATIALLIPSAVSQADSAAGAAFPRKLSVGLAVLLIVTYGLVYLVVAMTLDLLPPRGQSKTTPDNQQQVIHSGN